MIGRLFIPFLVAASLFAAADDEPWVKGSYRKTFNQLMTEGKYVEAEANARAVLADSEARYGRQSIMAALAWEMLTEVYYYGDHLRDPEAEQTGIHAVAIKEKVLGPDHPQVAVSLRLLGNLLSTQGDYERARKYYERAVAIHEKTAGQDPHQEVDVFQAFGTLLQTLGDFEAARSAYERAISIRAKYLPTDSLSAAMMWSNYAVLLREMGDYERARTHFLRAVAIFEQKKGPDHVIITECLSELGALLNKMNRAAEAKPLLERTLAIEEKAYGPVHVDIAFVLENLAAACASLGEFPRARALYERAIAIVTPVYGPSHPDVARILSGYAALLLRMGENRLALEAALRTEQIARDHLASTIRTQPERLALHYAATRANAIDVLVHLALADPAARRPVFDALIRSRALVFDEMAARHRLTARTSDATTAALWEELAAARRQLARLVVQGPGAFRSGNYASALDRARAENDRAERALAERSAGFRQEIVRREAGWSEITQTLKPGDALVSFIRYGGDPRHDRDQPAYVAFVARSGDVAPSVIPLGAAREIEALIDRLHREIQAEAEAPGRSRVLSESNYRAAGVRLRNRLWDPLLSALGDAQRVFLTPDHAVNLVDFATLPARQGGYLVEHGPLLNYVSAERDLISGPTAATGSGLLALGAPSFDRIPREPRLLAAATGAHVFRGGRPSCSEFRSMRFEPLPASLREVRDIAALWTKSGAGEVLQRTGEAASELALRQEAPGKKVVHIAAHGFFMGETCPSSDAVATGENPLLLSGIALAGANRRQTAPQEAGDGIITAEEISAMDMEGVEWAVLSACETGLGKLLPGEGVFGLRRAFQAAGARSVIMSLWPVDDVATQQWMIALYRKRFSDRLSTAESVRAANLEMLARRRSRGLSTHPFYWGGFIAVGG
jgi:CHAT domain-containing protein/Tfp pilus assembly protein PilF